MIKQECIGIPDMILLLMIFCFKKIKIKAEIVLSPGGAYFQECTEQSLQKLFREHCGLCGVIDLNPPRGFVFLREFPETGGKSYTKF